MQMECAGVLVPSGALRTTADAPGGQQQGSRRRHSGWSGLDQRQPAAHRPQLAHADQQEAAALQAAGDLNHDAARCAQAPAHLVAEQPGAGRPQQLAGSGPPGETEALVAGCVGQTAGLPGDSPGAAAGGAGGLDKSCQSGGGKQAATADAPVSFLARWQSSQLCLPRPSVIALFSSQHQLLAQYGGPKNVPVSLDARGRDGQLQLFTVTLASYGGGYRLNGASEMIRSLQLGKKGRVRLSPGPNGRPLAEAGPASEPAAGEEGVRRRQRCQGSDAAGAAGRLDKAPRPGSRRAGGRATDSHQRRRGRRGDRWTSSADEHESRSESSDSSGSSNSRRSIRSCAGDRGSDRDGSGCGSGDGSEASGSSSDGRREASQQASPVPACSHPGGASVNIIRLTGGAFYGREALRAAYPNQVDAAERTQSHQAVQLYVQLPGGQLQRCDAEIRVYGNSVRLSCPSALTHALGVRDKDKVELSLLPLAEAGAEPGAGSAGEGASAGEVRVLARALAAGALLQGRQGQRGAAGAAAVTAGGESLVQQAGGGPSRGGGSGHGSGTDPGGSGAHRERGRTSARCSVPPESDLVDEVPLALRAACRSFGLHPPVAPAPPAGAEPDGGDGAACDPVPVQVQVPVQVKVEPGAGSTPQQAGPAGAAAQPSAVAAARQSAKRVAAGWSAVPVGGASGPADQAALGPGTAGSGGAGQPLTGQPMLAPVPRRGEPESILAAHQALGADRGVAGAGEGLRSAAAPHTGVARDTAAPPAPPVSSTKRSDPQPPDVGGNTVCLSASAMYGVEGIRFAFPSQAAEALRTGSQQPAVLYALKPGEQQPRAYDVKVAAYSGRLRLACPAVLLRELQLRDGDVLSLHVLPVTERGAGGAGARCVLAELVPPPGTPGQAGQPGLAIQQRAPAEAAADGGGGDAGMEERAFRNGGTGAEEDLRNKRTDKATLPVVGDTEEPGCVGRNNDQPTIAVDAPAAAPPETALHPAAALSRLHGYVPPSEGLPPLQPGHTRVCGLTYSPDLAPAVQRALGGHWAERMGHGLMATNSLKAQISIVGMDAEEDGAGTSTGPCAVPWAAVFARHGLSRNIVCWRLGRLLGINADCSGAPLPEGPVELPGACKPCGDPDRGGAGLEAAQSIKKNAVLGVAGGLVLPRSKAEAFVASGYQHCRPDARQRLAGVVAGTSADEASAWQLLAGAFRVPLPAGVVDIPGQDGVEADLCMLGFGSSVALVNDPRVQPRAWLPGNDVDCEQAAERANCMLLPMSVRGLVLLVLVALRDIAPGEQLLRDYGADWWRGLADVWEVVEDDGLDMKRLLHGAHQEAQQRQGGPPAAMEQLHAASGIPARSSVASISSKQGIAVATGLGPDCVQPVAATAATAAASALAAVATTAPAAPAALLTAGTLEADKQIAPADMHIPAPVLHSQSATAACKALGGAAGCDAAIGELEGLQLAPSGASGGAWAEAAQGTAGMQAGGSGLRGSADERPPHRKRSRSRSASRGRETEPIGDPHGTWGRAHCAEGRCGSSGGTRGGHRNGGRHDAGERRRGSHRRSPSPHDQDRGKPRRRSRSRSLQRSRGSIVDRRSGHGRHSSSPGRRRSPCGRRDRRRSRSSSSHARSRSRSRGRRRDRERVHEHSRSAYSRSRSLGRGAENPRRDDRHERTGQRRHGESPRRRPTEERRHCERPASGSADVASGRGQQQRAQAEVAAQQAAREGGRAVLLGPVHGAQHGRAEGTQFAGGGSAPPGVRQCAGARAGFDPWQATVAPPAPVGGGNAYGLVRDGLSLDARPQQAPEPTALSERPADSARQCAKPQPHAAPPLPPSVSAPTLSAASGAGTRRPRRTTRWGPDLVKFEGAEAERPEWGDAPGRRDEVVPAAAAAAGCCLGDGEAAASGGPSCEASRAAAAAILMAAKPCAEQSPGSGVRGCTEPGKGHVDAHAECALPKASARPPTEPPLLPRRGPANAPPPQTMGVASSDSGGRRRAAAAPSTRGIGAGEAATGAAMFANWPAHGTERAEGPVANAQQATPAPMHSGLPATFAELPVSSQAINGSAGAVATHGSASALAGLVSALGDALSLDAAERGRLLGPLRYLGKAGVVGAQQLLERQGLPYVKGAVLRVKCAPVAGLKLRLWHDSDAAAPTWSDVRVTAHFGELLDNLAAADEAARRSMMHWVDALAGFAHSLELELDPSSLGPAADVARRQQGGVGVPLNSEVDELYMRKDVHLRPVPSECACTKRRRSERFPAAAAAAATAYKPCVAQEGGQRWYDAARSYGCPTYQPAMPFAAAAAPSAALALPPHLASQMLSRALPPGPGTQEVFKAAL